MVKEHVMISPWGSQTEKRIRDPDTWHSFFYRITASLIVKERYMYPTAYAGKEDV